MKSTRQVALENEEVVERATERLAEKNIQEDTTIMDGTLIGMVPTRRIFEFGILSTGDLLHGRIGLEVEEPHRLAAIYTNRRVWVRIRRVQIGRAEPKYTLLEVLRLADSPVPV